MKTLTKKLRNLSFIGIFFVVFAITFAITGTIANAQYDSGYGSSYDSGYGSYYDSGFGYNNYGMGANYGASSYDLAYGSSYGSSYGSGYGSSYYGGYDSSCYDCGYNYNYYDTCTTCDYVPPVTNLVVSCTPNTSNIDTDQSVTWSSHVSGGSGSYSYSWSGTDGLSGSGSQVSKTYYSTGSKNAHVTVTSGGRTASADCGVVYVEEQNQSLSGSCSVDDSNINRNQSVRWSADASGGNGSYSYEWSGTYPLSGRTGRDVSVSYDTTGTKYGTVVIRSGNQSITRTCGTVYVEDNQNYSNLNLSCTVNNASLALGQTAIWNTSVSGGNGNYYYSWTGTDGIYGNISSISKSFNTVGSKYATVTVTSDGRTKSLTCPTVVVGGLAYANLGAPAALSSVYLNQVPYTGVGDNPKLMAFLIGLFMFSALGAYMIVSRKAKTERKNKILDFKHENMARKFKI